VLPVSTSTTEPTSRSTSPSRSISPIATDFTRTLRTLATQTALPSPLVTSNVTVEDVVARQPSSFSEPEVSAPPAEPESGALPSDEGATPTEYVTTDDGSEYILLADGSVVDPSTEVIVGHVEGDEVVIIEEEEGTEGIVSTREELPEEEIAKQPIEEIVKEPQEKKPIKESTKAVSIKEFSADAEMSSNTKIMLTVGGIVAVGGLLWFMTRKPQPK